MQYAKIYLKKNVSVDNNVKINSRKNKLVYSKLMVTAVKK